MTTFSKWWQAQVEGYRWGYARGEAARQRFKLVLGKHILLFGIRCVLRMSGTVTIADDELILRVPFSADALEQIDDWCVEADLPIVETGADECAPN